MNFLLDPKLRQALIDQLDADGHNNLCIQLEQLPAILSTTVVYENYRDPNQFADHFNQSLSATGNKPIN